MEAPERFHGIYLEKVRESEIDHVVHPAQFESHIWSNQIVANEEARREAFLLPLQINRRARLATAQTEMGGEGNQTGE